MAEHIVERQGRFYARIVVPLALRPIIGSTELRAPLGSSRAEARRLSYAILAGFQERLEVARQKLRHEKEAEARKATETPRLSDLSHEEIARIRYAEWLAFDEELRNTSHIYSDGMVDDRQIPDLRNVISGSASNDEITRIIGFEIEQCEVRGFHNETPGTPGWRRLARILAMARLESIGRIIERDDGNFSGKPTIAPFLLEATVVRQERDTPAPSGFVSLNGLLDRHVRAISRLGRTQESERRWRPVFAKLCAFLGHDDALRVTKADLVKWRDNLLKDLSPKTVKDVYLAAVRAVFNSAVSDGDIFENPADGIKVRLPKEIVGREKGLTDDEATSLLRMAYEYKSPVASAVQRQEKKYTEAAKRWGPWLCAFSGARIAEIMQLRKEDIRLDGKIPFFRITPDAGSTKSSLYRDVPIHRQVLAAGFDRFVESSGGGPLFYRQGARKGTTHPSKQMSGRVSQWVRSLGVVGLDVDPDHGWRHRFKTITRTIGADPRVVDAIQGHASRTAGEHYGDVTLEARLRVVDALPDYPIVFAREES